MLVELGMATDKMQNTSTGLKGRCKIKLSMVNVRVKVSNSN